MMGPYVAAAAGVVVVVVLYSVGYVCVFYLVFLIFCTHAARTT